MDRMVPCVPRSSGLPGLLKEINDKYDEHGGGEQGASVTKLIGGTPEHPDYPRVTLSVQQLGYSGNYVGSVVVQRTGRSADTATSLGSMELMTACEYYLHLNSPEDLDAVEKAANASSPKAWAYICLIDRIRRDTGRPEECPWPEKTDNLISDPATVRAIEAPPGVGHETGE